MKTKKLIAATLAATMALAALPSAAHAVPVRVVPGPTFGGNPGIGFWSIFACAGGIITSAMVANATQNRELTWNEAASCGVLFWFAQPKKKKP